MMGIFNSSSSPTQGCRRLWLTGLLAALPQTAMGQAPAISYRSVGDVRPRLSDEHDRPYFRQTQSHRGFEIREPQFTVVAQTTADDAQWAASQVAGAWQQAGALADQWTHAHQQADFGLNALQVVITNEPLRERDAPATTVNVVGIQTQVEIHVGSGQPPLAQQVARLREGAAFAMLHASGLDAMMPPWVVAGMATVAGREGIREDVLHLDPDASAAVRFGGQQWRYARAAADVLDYPRVDHEEAASRIGFLLKGDDAEHAPAFLAAMRRATSRAADAAAQAAGFGAPHSAADVDQLLDGLHTRYTDWKKNPEASQPLFEPVNQTSPDVLAAEREMVVWLKLHRRFNTVGVSSTAPDAWATVPGGVARPISTKIVRFDPQQRTATTEQLKPPTPARSFATLVERLSDPSQPTWATLDVDGRLLLSTNRQRVEALLANAKQYSLEVDAGKTVLVRRLQSGDVIRGWLENGPPDKPRLMAKFTVAQVKPSGR